MSLSDQDTDAQTVSVDEGFERNNAGQEIVVTEEKIVFSGKVVENGKFTIEGNIKRIIKSIAVWGGYAGWLAALLQYIRPG